MRERLAFKIRAYSTKLVHKKMGSRILKDPPAPAPHAQNVAQQGVIGTDCAIYRMVQAFSVGFAETALTDSRKNHHKKS